MFLVRWVAAMALSACAACAGTGERAVSADLAILGGLIVDGTGAERRIGDVLVREGRIVFVGEAETVGYDATETIEAAGKIVAPGFIDLHSHGNPLQESFENFLLQGVTTVVLGQDGRSPYADDDEFMTRATISARRPEDRDRPATLADWLAAAEAAPLDVNIAALSGFGTNRVVAGVGAAPVPTAEQLAIEKDLLAADLEAGAFGMSSGLEYPPDRYSETAELVALAEIVGAHDGVVMSHLRTEDDEAIADAIAELAAQGEQARVHISHLKIVFGKSREQAEAVLAQIRAARAAGVQMSADVYPYIAGFADLSLVYPPWAKRKEEWDEAVRERRDELETYLRARVLKRNGPEAILIASGPYAGLTLKEVAAREKMSFEDVIIDLFDFGGPDAAHRVMAAEVQEAFVAAPDIAISTDGGPGIGHPRSWGSYPKVLHDYVAESGRLPIEAAIHKMTGLPAKILGLEKRGRIEEGAIADLVIIDLSEIESTATWEKHDRVPRGVDAVIVNGIVAARDGARAGRVLRAGMEE